MDLDFLRKKDFSYDKTWKRAFDLALAIWRVSGAFPPDDQSSSEDILRIKLRKLASGIISDLAPKKIFDDVPEEKLKLIFEAARKIEDLRAHLRLVQNLELTKEINCQVLDKEFRLLKEELLKEALDLAEEIEKEKTAKIFQKSPVKREAVPVSQNRGETASPTFSVLAANGAGRLEKISSRLRERKILQLKDLLNFFPEFSEKTIRNDLKQLCGQNLIERVGNGAGSYYRLV